MRGSFANRIKVLREIADGNDADAKSADRIRAIDVMAKYGLGEAKGYDEGLVEALGAAVRGDVSDEVWERIRARWVVVIGLHVRGA